MTTLPDAALPCDRCGYDVRAQPADGVCPECGESVERSRRAALVPRRPAWRDSDPRWRRRVLAGAWVLVLLPAVPALRAAGWDRHVPMPTFYAVQGALTLRDSYLPSVYGYLLFCVGVVLLFARERGRRIGRFDWTRRWGIVASYGVLVLGALPILFITSLVILGIGAMFVTIRPKFAPPYADAFVAVGHALVRYGPHPGRVVEVALPACSAVVVLLACAPLFDALRSCGRRAWAIALLVPLAQCAARQLVYVALDAVHILSKFNDALPIHDLFFAYDDLATHLLNGLAFSRENYVEVSQWLACLAIAVRLSVAQVAVRRPLRTKAGRASVDEGRAL